MHFDGYSNIVRCGVVFFSLLLIVPYSQAFQGGGGGFFLGTGTPSSVDASRELSEDLGINEESGNFSAGAFGFYQGPHYRFGASFQTHVWAGWNIGNDEADNDSAGLAAFTGGLYATYSVKTGRIQFNIGGVMGAGRVALGYSLKSQNRDLKERNSVSTFYIEPQASVGLGTCRWFVVEFQVSAPIFLFDDELTLTVGDKRYVVESHEMNGVTFSIKLLFGVVAEL